MRELTVREQKILEIMLGKLPVLTSELHERLLAAKVIEIDCEGSLRLDVVTPIFAEVAERVPITATFHDSDGIPVYLLLHVVGGKLAELEIYKADGSPILTEPSPEKLEF
jgi:hypothetical protein